MFVTNPDGTMGGPKASQSVSEAIGKGQKKRDYAKTRITVFAIFRFPITLSKWPHPDVHPSENAEERAAVDAFNQATAAYVQRWMDNLKSGVPGARFVDLPGAGHFIFLTRETEVLKAVHTFVAGL